MANQTLGCTYCLEPVNSSDPLPELCPLVQCQCGAVYHAVCREKVDGCLHCNSTDTNLITAYPKPLIVQNRKKPTRIPSKETWGSTGKETVNFWESLRAIILPSFQISRALIVALILIAVSIFTGLFTYRVIMLFNANPSVKADYILDAILKASLPNTPSILGALASGITFGLLFYFPRLLRKWKNDENSPSTFTLFGGGIAVLIWLDVAYLSLRPSVWVDNFLNVLKENAETLTAQVGTMVMTIILLLLYRYLAPLTFYDEGTPSPSAGLFKIFIWLRFLVISIVLVGLAGIIASGRIEYGLQLGPESPHTSIAWITSSVLAALLYYPRIPNSPPRWVAFFRVLLIMGGILAWSFLYSQTPYTSDFRQATIDSAILVLIAVPLQRTLC